jgi:hypothetical protein
MTNSNTWATPQRMVDWFNQLDDPDAFFKENCYRRFPFIQDSISLKSESVQITLSTVPDLERQQNCIELGCQRDLILGYASVSVELYIEDRDIEASEMTFVLKLPMSLEPKEFFNYIDSKIVSVQDARKAITHAFKLEMEQD